MACHCSSVDFVYGRLRGLGDHSRTDHQSIAAPSPTGLRCWISFPRFNRCNVSGAGINTECAATPITNRTKLQTTYQLGYNVYITLEDTLEQDFALAPSAQYALAFSLRQDSLTTQMQVSRLAV